VPPIAPDVEARIIALRATKLTHRAIAAEVGTPTSTVGDVLRRHERATAQATAQRRVTAGAARLRATLAQPDRRPEDADATSTPDDVQAAITAARHPAPGTYASETYPRHRPERGSFESTESLETWLTSHESDAVLTTQQKGWLRRHGLDIQTAMGLADDWPAFRDWIDLHAVKPDPNLGRVDLIVYWS
jgi:hypothetical protein